MSFFYIFSKPYQPGEDFPGYNLWYAVRKKSSCHESALRQLHLEDEHGPVNSIVPQKLFHPFQLAETKYSHGSLSG